MKGGAYSLEELEITDTEEEKKNSRIIIEDIKNQI